MTHDLSEIKDMQSSLSKIDNAIQQVLSEGYGSTRIVNLFLPSPLRMSDNQIYFRKESYVELYDYPSRKIEENFILISGQSFCYEHENYITIENDYLKVVFQKIQKTDPMQDIDTKNNIISLTQKTLNRTIYPSDTSIMLDNDPETSHGKGYSYLLKEGNQPICIVVFHVESTKTYDIYYKLFAGADFLIIEVKNIT